VKAILAVNAGSSSLKFAAYQARAALSLLASGEISGIGHSAKFKSRRGDRVDTRPLDGVVSATDALDVMDAWRDKTFPDVEYAVIAHRIVHGGVDYFEATIVTDAVLADLEKLDPLAPQHQPFNLAMVRALRTRFPQSTAVACFDTAFHHGWSETVKRIAIPRHLFDAGVRRYGFHGLSYEFLTQRVRELAPGARCVVLAHLGSGASICGTLDGNSVDCTMGFSVLGGLPMATRCGQIDPGVIFHLHRQFGLGFEQIEHMLYYDSGLKGVSGISGDVRELLGGDSPAAREAIEVFVDHCVGEIGAMAAKLGGIDALVFSGGIGAHAPGIRMAIGERLGLFGVGIDSHANASALANVASSASRIPVFAIETDEQLMLARHAWTFAAPNS
jgi:acetate kinase